MASVHPECNRATRPPKASHPGQRQRLQECHERPGREVKKLLHSSTETNLADAILEIIRSIQDFDLNAHEIDRQIAPIDLWKTHGVFLGGNDVLGLALFTSIDGVEHFLLRKTMMICEALGINQFRPKLHQTLFEALRLSNTTEGGHPAASQNLQSRSLPGENVLQIQRVMDALNDPRGRIELRNSAAQFRGITIAFRNKNCVCARQMRRGL